MLFHHCIDAYVSSSAIDRIRRSYRTKHIWNKIALLFKSLVIQKIKTQNICFMHSWLTPKRLNCCKFCQFVSSLVLVLLSFLQTELVKDPHVQPKQVSTSSPTLDTRPSCRDAPFTVAVPAPSASPGKDSYDILIKIAKLTTPMWA